LRPLPGRGLDSVIVGDLPVKLVQILNDRLREAILARQTEITTRTE